MSRTDNFMFRAVRNALGLAAIVLLMSVGAVAQLAGKGALTGTVQDSTGAAIPNATVVITNDATGVPVTLTSSGSGDFVVSTLDPGIYTVSVTAAGFEKLTQKNVHINALESVTYNPKLKVGGSDQTVTVDDAPPLLETTNATLGATMEQEVYAALPIEMGAYGQPGQRRATDFAFLMPGVQGNNTNGNPTTNTGVVNGSGSRGAVTAVYIDGIPFVRAGGNGDPRFVWSAISVDAVDQFQVQTSGYSAIYEGQGVQNYTVKGGGARYHGSIYEFFRNTALDTWGFYGAVPNAITGQVKKPIENQNEYGINVSGPLVPFGGLKDKLFYFGNYNGYRYAQQIPTAITFPTAAWQSGNFQGALSSTPGTVQNPTNPIGAGGIFDPNTQTQCTANNGGKPCRYRYGYGPGGVASASNPGGGVLQCAAPYTCVDVIPSSEFSPQAVKMQSFLPNSAIGTANQNNYISPNKDGRVNWSTTHRIDWHISPKHDLTLVGAIGRQSSINPAGQQTAGRNVGPIPYNYGQTFAPKTAVGIIEETWTINQHLVNQIKYGYARYNGPTFDADQVPQYSATTMGISEAAPGLPAGAAQQAFPIVTFAGTNAPTNWGGTTPNVTLAENYTLLDNLQWVKGKHNLTFGGQTAWLLYNTITATGGSTPITLANAVTETEGLNSAFTAISNTGHSYASFLIGQIDRASFTQYLQQEFGARFRAISPYVQDNWKVTNRLTLDLGLRWDYFPSVTEVHNAESFFSPTLVNPVTNLPGALQFAGTGSGTCNCSTPVTNWKKNFGPRLGLAYQLDDKTVIRASYGVMFTHGNAVGGSAFSLGTLGFSGGLSASANGSLLSTAPLGPTNGGVLPTYTVPTGVLSGAQFGTGYTTTAGYTGTPQSFTYPDSYLGSRAPEYVNWTFGFQHEWKPQITSTITYVGSQGHFLPTDGGNPRGYWANQLDPQYLFLGTRLADTGTTATTVSADCTTYSLPCAAHGLSQFTTGQSLATFLRPFPFQGVADTFGYVANANYNALQATINVRNYHGFVIMANYTWGRAIDDGGTFRTGYYIPPGYVFNQPGRAWAADRIERTISTSNQPQHLVVTSVWDLPFGKTVWANNAVARAVLGGFKLSTIFQAYSGSPLPITASSCQTNQAQTTCLPNLNPAYAGPGRINGKWGKGSTATNSLSYIDPSTCTAGSPAVGPFIAPSCVTNSAYVTQYTFSNSPRTAPYNIYGPGNYDLDLALVRTFPLHFEGTKLTLRGEYYNITNHTFFGVASTQLGNSSFGQVTPNAANPQRKSAQLSARLEF